MRIEVTFTDRVGIAHEILAVLALRRLNVVGVEVDPPLIHIDAPGLDPAALPALSDALRRIAGVQAVAAIDMLPGTRRRLHLDALLAALPDPVLAVDREARVVVASAAAAQVAGLPESRLAGPDLGDLFGEPGLTRELADGGFRMSGREVTLNGQPFLLEVTPIVDVEAAGAVITLFTPSRLGERLNAIQNFDEGGFDRILGESPPVRALKARAARVAAMEAPLLILGETGTGKELIAHACHRASPRRDKPFLALNCAAVPENLAESELFGYAPGSFTGAQRGGKPGLLELAHGGTVFLDEIGEMSAYLQAKLLRFLNDGSFRRVGGEREQKVDVRVISATHRSLEAMVTDHSFREDLFYRLNVLTLSVPPLRERGQDILLLARHFIARAAAQARRPPGRLTPAAAAALLANRWPGNVRQLENVIFRAVTMSDGGTLDAANLELAGAGMQSAEVPAEDAESWEEAVDGFERSLLRRLYPRFPSSRKLAARLNTSHTMIANKLRKYGIPER
ncbi:sigma 54-interacting transcriptional regulator [Azospirillum lipoferum]|uniref:HTH-type transcriptional regulatory protein TyrR n=1 Tax=Azospirillum lipoferum (strain 4B) TaxID=862719 RepID=G7ZHD8_AZOL4|nr:sigma 54-interacting transcriptional regulator [Azospirillum lipoferum]CBS91242.1 DNA-binding transcriptional dual regulator, tyrosine-binding [Azospirillum lipoferum 4B]